MSTTSQRGPSSGGRVTAHWQWRCPQCDQAVQPVPANHLCTTCGSLLQRTTVDAPLALVSTASERELLETIRELAAAFGWRYYHTHDSRRSPAGFPDVVLVRPPRLIFAELKAAGGRATTEQTAWLADLAGCAAAEVYVWRPSMLDYITACLRGEGGPCAS